MPRRFRFVVDLIRHAGISVTSGASSAGARHYHAHGQPLAYTSPELPSTGRLLARYRASAGLSLPTSQRSNMVYSPRRVSRHDRDAGTSRSGAWYTDIARAAEAGLMRRLRQRKSPREAARPALGARGDVVLPPCERIRGTRLGHSPNCRARSSARNNSSLPPPVPAPRLGRCTFISAGRRQC